LRGLETLPPPDGATDFRRVAETLVRLDQTPGPVVIISDFCDCQSFLAGLDFLRVAGRSPRVIHLVDPAEDDTLSPGDIELADAEGNAVWEVTLTESQLRRYRNLATEDRERPRRHCQKYHLPYVRVGIAIPDRCTLGDIIALRTSIP
jgi:hypothetical protein